MSDSGRSVCKLVSVAALSALWMTGCQTPDLKPFRESTAKIHRSVVDAQDIYSGELERLRPFVPNDQGLSEQEQRFTTNWSARIEVMDAMVKYAASLAAVADAPNKSKAALEGVAQSLNELAAATGPYQQAVQGATGIASEIANLVNRVRAARQLKKAVLITDTNIQQVAELLAKDFGKMKRTLEENQKSIKNLMDGKMSHQLDLREAVLKKIEVRSQELQGHLSENWVAAVAAFNQELAEPRAYLAEADKWYLPHKAEVEAAQKEMTDRVKLFRDTKTALAQWGRAHGALAQALNAGLPPDWTLLKQSADRIETSINKITGENSKP